MPASCLKHHHLRQCQHLKQNASVLAHVPDLFRARNAAALWLVPRSIMEQIPAAAFPRGGSTLCTHKIQYSQNSSFTDDCPGGMIDSKGWRKVSGASGLIGNQPKATCPRDLVYPTGDSVNIYEMPSMRKNNSIAAGAGLLAGYGIAS
jgi:hypothetical protein